MLSGFQIALLAVAVLGAAALVFWVMTRPVGAAAQPSSWSAAYDERALEFAFDAAAKIRTLSDADLLAWEAVRINSVYEVIGAGEAVLSQRWSELLTERAKLEADLAALGDARARLRWAAAERARRG